MSYNFHPDERESTEVIETRHVHCDYGDCDATFTVYKKRDKQVNCERGLSCPKYRQTACPFEL